MCETDLEEQEKKRKRQAAFQKAFGFELTENVTEEDRNRMKTARNTAIRDLGQLIEDTQISDWSLYSDNIDHFTAAEMLVQGTMASTDNYHLMAQATLQARSYIKTLEALRESGNAGEAARNEQTRQQRMQQIGDRATTPQDAGFVVAAIKARFNIDVVAGHLTGKTLPRLYKLLSALPEGQTRFNDSLKKIVRGAEAPTSDFSASENRININIGSMTDTSTCETPNGPVVVNKFDWTTLHEVGHSLDEAVGFMNARKKKEKYGGWRELSIGDVIEEGVKAFKKSWKDQRPADQQIAELFRQAIEKGSWAPVTADQKTLSNESLAQDPTVKWACALWAKAQMARSLEHADAASLALDGHVYINNTHYRKWYSYLLSARDAQVSNYQFFAPPEWFAEVYAMRWLDKLPASHPCYNEIATLDGRTKVTE